MVSCQDVLSDCGPEPSHPRADSLPIPAFAAEYSRACERFGSGSSQGHQGLRIRLVGPAVGRVN